MPSPTQISVDQLAKLIGTQNCPVLIDVCVDEDFNLDPRVIPTAFRYSHSKIANLAPQLTEQKVVVICQKGLKLSEGAAAILRAHGVQAENLAGGVLAWRDAKQMLIPVAKIPVNTAASTVWVTKQRPKVDRIACAWLIKRFIDPKAQFLFVAASQVRAVAEKFDATPFDVEDVFFSHRQQYCTFDVLIQEFELTSQPLLRLAEIVRDADTNRLDLTPQSAGLLAAALGLSRMHKNDLQQLNDGMVLYDAFYRWARDAVYENHDWPDKKRSAR